MSFITSPNPRTFDVYKRPSPNGIKDIKAVRFAKVEKVAESDFQALNKCRCHVSMKGLICVI